MKRLLHAIRRQPIEALLAIALAALSLQLYLGNKPTGASASEMMLHADQGNADMSLRNADFPATFIRSIHVDLSSPNHWVTLTWTGPRAAHQETGPFHSSPGAGKGTNDCDDVAESNRGGSKCTPKGIRTVEGFSDHLQFARSCVYVTWFHSSREIAFHSNNEIPNYPASNGCVRISEHAAQLIHNNSIVGQTEVVIDGTWTPPPASGTDPLAR